MSKATSDLRPFSKLSPDEDPENVAALIRSVQEAPDEDFPRVRWRLRASLRQQPARPRRFLRMALVAGGIFLTGGMVGAVVRPFWGLGPAGPAATSAPPDKAKPQPARKRAVAAPAEASLPVAPLEPSPQHNQVDNQVVAAPAASYRAPTPPARRASAAPVISDRPLPSEASAAKAAPSPVAVEQALLGDILKSLRAEHDAKRGLALLDEHARLFPGTVLGPEVAMLRAEALLGLGRKAEALSVLDRLSLASVPNRDERLVLRGELRAAAGRWSEAREDFDTQWTPLSSAMDSKSRDLKERALWGRASARSHLGDGAGARADLATYLHTFPSCRFAAQAAALLQGSP